MPLPLEIPIGRASASAAADILALQKRAYLSEAAIIDDYTIPPLHQTLEEILSEFESQIFLTATNGKTIVGSVRCWLEKGTCYIGRLIVHPGHQNRGLGKKLLETAEAWFPEAERFKLFTGQRSEKNLHIYTTSGYRQFKTQVVSDKLTLVYLEKARSHKG